MSVPDPLSLSDLEAFKRLSQSTLIAWLSDFPDRAMGQVVIWLGP